MRIIIFDRGGISKEQINQRRIPIVQYIRENIYNLNVWTFDHSSYKIIAKVKGRGWGSEDVYWKLSKFCARPSVVAITTTTSALHLLSFTYTSNTPFRWALSLTSLSRQLDHNVFDGLNLFTHVNHWIEIFCMFF